MDKINSGSYRGQPNGADVMTFIKKFVCDNTLAQDPLLTMTHGRAFNYVSLPSEKKFRSKQSNVFLFLVMSCGLPKKLPSREPGLACPRMLNNHRESTAADWKKFARAVELCYGHKYRRAVEYLENLANNAFWRDSELTPLPWLQENPRSVDIQEPRFLLQPAVLNALAPAVPLRAIFSGDRRV